MLAVPRAFACGRHFRDTSAAATDPSTLSTSGASHTKGSWVQLGSDLTDNVSGFWLGIESGTAPSAADARALLDIGVDLAGGTSFTAILSDLNVNGVSNTNKHVYYVPLRIPAGAAVAVRHQAALASDVIECMFVAETPSAPWQAVSFAYCDTYGADTAASEGTAITTANQGASGAEGTWVQIEAAADRDYSAIMLGLGADAGDTNQAARGLVCDIGIDPDGGSTYIPLVENIDIQVGSTEQYIQSVALAYGCEIPEGSSLAVRVSASGTASDDRSAILYCFA